MSLFADAIVDLLEIKTMLHGARLDQIPLRDIVVVTDQAVCEAEGELRIGIELCGAEEDHVPQTFGRAVLAADGGGVRIDARGRQKGSLRLQRRKERLAGAAWITYLPMKLSSKSTLSWNFSITGTMSSCKQAFASGHLDMMCASSDTL